MNECLLVIGTILFAVAGAYNFCVEFFLPVDKIENKLKSKCPTKTAGKVICEAQQIKSRMRMIGFGLIWGAGLVVSILGLVG